MRRDFKYEGDTWTSEPSGTDRRERDGVVTFGVWFTHRRTGRRLKGKLSFTRGQDAAATDDQLVEALRSAIAEESTSEDQSDGDNP